jgi:hypothetical protein
LVHNFRTRCPEEISCFFGTVTSFAYASTCLSGPDAIS